MREIDSTLDDMTKMFLALENLSIEITKDVTFETLQEKIRSRYMKLVRGLHPDNTQEELSFVLKEYKILIDSYGIASNSILLKSVWALATGNMGVSHQDTANVESEMCSFMLSDGMKTSFYAYYRSLHHSIPAGSVNCALHKMLCNTFSIPDSSLTLTLNGISGFDCIVSAEHLLKINDFLDAIAQHYAKVFSEIPGTITVTIPKAAVERVFRVGRVPSEGTVDVSTVAFAVQRVLALWDTADIHVQEGALSSNDGGYTVRLKPSLKDASIRLTEVISGPAAVRPALGSAAGASAFGAFSYHTPNNYRQLRCPESTVQDLDCFNQRTP